MLSQEENELLTRTGPGTPCGEFMRRYWQPIALAEELPNGAPPKPIRLLSEDLVLFRDDQGRVGLLGLHCSHRGADLSYGRIEDGGLRCLYHGWLYNIQGRCLQQPGERSETSIHEKIRHKAYPCVEMGGLILAYLGPGMPPSPPEFEFLKASDDRRFNSKIFHECNYLQANEGNIDPIHTPFLHRTFGSRLNAPPPPPASQRWFVPMEVEKTPYGVRVTRADPGRPGTLHVRVTNFVLPNLSAFAAGTSDGYTVNWHVPIDDTHHWKYVVVFTKQKPIDGGEMKWSRAELTPDYRLVRNKANRYLQDREEMKTLTFTGMGKAFQVHDAFATEGEGPIQDRTEEHPGYTDRAIILARRIMLHLIRETQEGRELPYPDKFPIPVWAEDIPDSQDWGTYARARTLAAIGL